MYRLDQPEESQRTPKFVLIAIGGLLVGAIALVILIGMKKNDNSTYAGSSEFVKATQEVVSNHDLVIGVNNATLYVSQDAATMPGMISIVPREPNLFSNAPETGWTRSPVVDVEYQDEQGMPYPNVSFAKPVQICFRITAELWEAYAQHPDEFQVHFYAQDLSPTRWQPLPLTAHPDRLQLCGETTHLSIFALAIKKQTVIPVTGATPTLVFVYPTVTGAPNSDVGSGGDGTIVAPTSVTSTEPPPTEPSATEPPATEPPATEPPVTEPPVTEPPATDPPATEPPATDPPATDQPATDPPVTDPPVVP